MKIVKFLDQKGTALVSDPLNQTILKNLVAKELSISELASKMNMPTLKLWRRIQKLAKANLVILTRTEKSGNLEKKMYRATATRYVPQQFFDLKPKDANLKAAFDIYSDIQKDMWAKVSNLGDVPATANPTDYALFASMQSFAEVCTEQATQAKLEELEKELTKFQKQSGLTK